MMDIARRPFTLRQFWFESYVWSLEAFGTHEQRGPRGPLDHLKKEAIEAYNNPNDLEEYADLIHLVFDAARRAGFTYDELVAACFYKLAVNKRRVWPPVGSVPSDKAAEHDRSRDPGVIEDLLREACPNVEVEGDPPRRHCFCTRADPSPSGARRCCRCGKALDG